MLADGPGRERGPVDEHGHGGSWLRSPGGISFPSNVARSYGTAARPSLGSGLLRWSREEMNVMFVLTGHDDGSEDDPFASAEEILIGIWGCSGSEMTGDEMTVNVPAACGRPFSSPS